MKPLTMELIDDGYLKTPSLILTWKKIDRADFLPTDMKDSAEMNTPLAIGHGQTISQPLTVAFMLELLAVSPGNKILDVGSGSGWQTAILAAWTGSKGKVFAVEVIPELKQFGEQNVSKYNFIASGRVKFFCRDAWKGLKEYAPYDRIIVAAAAESVPEALLRELKAPGRLVMPVGERWSQSIILIIKDKKGNVIKKDYPGFVFVPLVKH